MAVITTPFPTKGGTRLLSAYSSGYIMCSFTFYSGSVYCVLIALHAGARDRGSGVNKRDAVFNPRKLIA